MDDGKQFARREVLALAAGAVGGRPPRAAVGERPAEPTGSPVVRDGELFVWTTVLTYDRGGTLIRCVTHDNHGNILVGNEWRVGGAPRCSPRPVKVVARDLLWQALPLPGA